MEYTRLCDLNRKERKRLNRIVRRQRKRGVLRSYDRHKNGCQRVE